MWYLGLKNITANGTDWASIRYSYTNDGVGSEQDTWTGTHGAVGYYASAKNPTITKLNWMYGNHESKTRPNSTSVLIIIKY